ncbi:hypothetical protein B0H19DRAFT_927723 [Mycena capillaripes]|nr:hypothetical protein B0H19DRAFT_948070 [Mycena capillaripes]KAJ6555990.1 hypothetical protein B0H19DRAFT_947633 [Mycena capillaripes]KAJ6581713.1 hypothetical protein B0H19DRAFT_927723 [Mycena capillaripes]
MNADAHSGDSVRHFLMECHRISTETQFIVDSLPNAETPAVERVTHQLDAIRDILTSLNDPYLQGDDLDALIFYDSLETFRQIFMYLAANDLLVMENPIHAACLFLVFQPRIQASLNRTRDAWNHHKIRTAGNRTPIALYELSRETAIRRGYWTGDMGDTRETASDPLYGYDGEAPNPPAGTQADSVESDPTPTGTQEQREAGICVNDDDELGRVRDLMQDFDFDADDGNWGIDVYCRAVLLLSSRILNDH